MKKLLILSLLTVLTAPLLGCWGGQTCSRGPLWGAGFRGIGARGQCACSPCPCPRPCPCPCPPAFPYAPPLYGPATGGFGGFPPCSSCGVFPGMEIPGAAIPGPMMPGAVMPGMAFPGTVMPGTIMPGAIIQDEMMFNNQQIPVLPGPTPATAPPAT